MAADILIKAALDKGAQGDRLSRDEALSLARIHDPDHVHAMGRAALKNRQTRFGDAATYIVNRQINPSNICEGGCNFCRYAAKETDEHAYSLDESEIIQALLDVNPSEAHIVGGLNRVWPFQRNLELVKLIRRQFPDIFIKGFTAVEMDWFSKQTGKSILEILSEFKAVGLDGMPGGGAELFSVQMRKTLCPDKLPGEDWIRIHETAHGLGLISNATMLYGIGESPEDRVDHLLMLRDSQYRSGGFACFIPLAYQPGTDGSWEDKPAPIETLGVIALSRLILDNVPHIKAYWPMIGLETAAAALSWGADDMDGTIGDERIAHAAGAETPGQTTRKLMEETITLGGFRPVERDGRFRPRVKT